MVLGVLFVAFGTQRAASPQTFCSARVNSNEECTYSVSLVDCVPQGGVLICTSVFQHESPDFTLNYIGGVVAVLGAVTFGAAYPTGPSGRLRIFPATT